VSPSAARARDDERNLVWVRIDDFTPGAFDNSFISTAEPQLSAPLGACDAIETWCCAAIGKNLGLGPLPALVQTGVYPNAMPGSSTKAFLTGFAVNPGLNNVEDELILIFEADDGVTHYLYGFSDVPQIPAVNQFLNDTGTPQAGLFGSPYPTWTRMNTTGVNPSPVLVFPAAIGDSHGINGHLYVYPNLLAPGTFTVTDLIQPSGGGFTSVTGQVVCYGSRVICLVGKSYTWPVAGGINTNENLNFTDPPQTNNYLAQGDTLIDETPWGYGAFGTVSVGELMLLKKHGGGVIIYGDIDAITSAISMPGVQSVGDFVGRAGAGPLGLVYCSEQRGAWTWNGGNTAQKISQQLRDSFYDAFSATTIGSNNYGFYVEHWQDWILFSNNYLFDVDKGGWWQLYPGDGNGSGAVTGHTFFWYAEGQFGNTMYAAPLQFGTAGGLTKNWWYKFDAKTPAPHWQWVSLPIEVITNGDRVMDVRQITCELSDPSNSGNATATVTLNGTSIGTVPAGEIGLHPGPFRFNVGDAGRGIEHIDIQFNGDNAVSGSSPILHSIDIGYQPRAGVPVSN
jgi:hypothetical protein